MEQRSSTTMPVGETHAEQKNVWPGIRIFGRLLDILFVISGPGYLLISLGVLVYMARTQQISLYATLLLIGTQFILSLALSMYGLCGVFVKRAVGLVIERTNAMRRGNYVQRDQLVLALGDNLGIIIVTALVGSMFFLIGVISFGVEPIHSLQKSLL